MSEIKIKPGCENNKIAFGKSGKKLSERNDLHELVLHARRANDNHILGMFVNPPTLEELEIKNTDRELAEATPSVETTAVTAEGADQSKGKKNNKA